MNSLPIYVLNLDRSTSRLDWCEDRLGREGLRFTRIPGVDGTRLSQAEIAAVYDERKNRKHYFMPLTSGEIGAYLGHLAAWKRLLEDNAEAALVLEDDFAIERSLAELVEAIERRPMCFDLLRLYGRPGGPRRGLGWLVPGLRVEERAISSVGCVAQVITRECARKLINTMIPIVRPVDVELQFWWQHDLTIHHVQPAPITTHGELQRRSEVKFAQPRLTRAKIRRELLRPLFRLKLALMSLWFWGIMKRK